MLNAESSHKAQVHWYAFNGDIGLEITMLLCSSYHPDSELGFTKYFAILKKVSGWIDRTNEKRGKDPEWNNEFLW